MPKIFKLLILNAALFVLTGCGPSFIVDKFEVANPQQLPTATIAAEKYNFFGGVNNSQIEKDGKYLGEAKSLVLPAGNYTLAVSYKWDLNMAVTLLTGVSASRSAEGHLKLRVEPGKNYKLNSESDADGAKHYFWIEEIDSGKIISGKRAPKLI